MDMVGKTEGIPTTVCSGAAGTVGPTAAGRAFPTAPTQASQVGLGYRAANGSPIRTFGERTLEGQTSDGQGL